MLKSEPSADIPEDGIASEREFVHVVHERVPGLRASVQQRRDGRATEEADAPRAECRVISGFVLEYFVVVTETMFGALGRWFHHLHEARLDAMMLTWMRSSVGSLGKRCHGCGRNVGFRRRRHRACLLFAHLDDVLVLWVRLRSKASSVGQRTGWACRARLADRNWKERR